MLQALARKKTYFSQIWLGGGRVFLMLEPPWDYPKNFQGFSVDILTKPKLVSLVVCLRIFFESLVVKSGIFIYTGGVALC